MKTLHLDETNLTQAANILLSGGIVAIPTETVYGLAGSVFNPQAIKKIFAAKGRPSDNPLIVHISDIGEIYNIVSYFSPKAKKLAEKFWPGPLTIILPKNKNIPDEVTAGMDSVAVRFPSNKIAREIIKKSGVPLVAPSANLSGKPSPTQFSHVVKDLDGKVDAIIDGGNCDIGVESTVVSFLQDTPKLLRPGAITPEDIEKTIGKIEIDKSVFEKISSNQKVLSPGTKYKHYSPKAKVIMVKAPSEIFSKYVNFNYSPGVIALCLDEDISYLKVPYISYGSIKNSMEQAHNIFDKLRKTDELNAKLVYAHFYENDEVSIAVYNRLVRAAGFEIVDLT